MSNQSCSEKANTCTSSSPSQLDQRLEAMREKYVSGLKSGLRGNLKTLLASYSIPRDALDQGMDAALNVNRQQIVKETLAEVAEAWPKI